MTAQNMKKFFIALLAGIMLVSSAACAAQSVENQNTDVTAAASDTAAEQPQETQILPDLPELDFQGETFNVLASCWSEKDMYAEEQTGDTMNDAIYIRNTKVEDQFNVKLNTIAVKGAANDFGPALNALRQAVKAGDDVYDVFFNIQAMAIADAMEDMFVDWAELPYVDLSKPWWDKGILDVCMGDKVYFATGDICLSTAGYTTLMCFNKNLFEDNNIEFPYDAVRAGTWTYDKFIGIIKDLQSDLNGDGKITPDDDLYTITGWRYEMPYNFHTSLGGNEIVKSTDGYPEVAIFSEPSMTAYEKSLDIFAKYGGYINTQDYGYERTMFKNRRSFLLDVRFFEAETLRDMEDDFGMIPHPKPDESKPYYTQLVNSNVATVVVVPVTNIRLEMTSAILEALAYQSSADVIPVYKEVLLQTKLTRDNESEDMFDYIWGNRTYRYGLAVYDNVLMNLMIKQNYNIVSEYEKLAKRADKEIQKITEYFYN